MASRIITDISDFIFVEDTPEPADAIFLPGGTHAEQPEYAAALYRQGYGKWLIPSGGVSVKKEKWLGVSSKAEVYTGDYHTECEFFIDVLRKNGVPASAIVGEFQSGHTRDNAFLSRQAVDEKGLVFPHGPHRLQGLPRPALPDALPAGLPRSLLQGLPGALLQHHQGELVQDRGGPPPGAGGAGPVRPPVCGGHRKVSAVARGRPLLNKKRTGFPVRFFYSSVSSSGPKWSSAFCTPSSPTGVVT